MSAQVGTGPEVFPLTGQWPYSSAPPLRRAPVALFAWGLWQPRFLGFTDHLDHASDCPVAVLAWCLPPSRRHQRRRLFAREVRAHRRLQITEHTLALLRTRRDPPPDPLAPPA